MIEVPAHDPLVVVDDDEIDRVILTKVIQRSHLDNDVITFSSGEGLITYLNGVADHKVTCPALVFLDINMPGMTGFDVLLAVRSRQEFTDIPVIAMVTSSDAEKDQARATELGANDYLAKQSGLNQFVDLVNNHFINSHSNDSHSNDSHSNDRHIKN